MTQNYKYYALIITVLFLLQSCVNNNANKKATAVTPPPSLPVKHINYDSLYRDCTDRTDTIIDENNAVHYIVVDSLYTLKLKVGGKDTVLGYGFDCSAPRGLIPVLKASYKNTICLVRGGGQHFREFIIASNEEGNIIIKYYEIALAVDLPRGIVVYLDYENLSHIISEELRTGEKRIHKIKSANLIALPEVSIQKEKLKVTFCDGQKVSFSLK